MTTEYDKDDKVSARYGELGRAEPPAHLDDAILAASRRAVQAAPRSGGARRWYVPVSLAAAVTLTVLVTLNVREERPDLESPVSVAEAPRPAPVPERAPRPVPPVESRSAPAAESAPAAQPAPPPATAAREPARQRNDVRPRPQFAPEPGPVAAAKPAEAAHAAPSTATPSTAGAGATTGELASQAPARAMARSAPLEMRDRADLRDRAEAMAKRAEDSAQTVETPERMLERIAVLRAEGKHADADKLLAEFRQRHPRYRIPEATLEKVDPAR